MTSPADLLPPGATRQERCVSAAIARIITPDSGAVRRSWDAGECPVSLLPWLAWAMGVDHWDAAWTEEQKRASIRAALGVHRRRGTIGAIKRAVAALGYNARIVENIEGPFTFGITLENSAGITASTIAAMERVALATKNARSHLVSLLTTVEVAGPARVAASVIMGDTVTVWPAYAVSATSTPAAAILAHTRTAETLTVQPA